MFCVWEKIHLRKTYSTWVFTQSKSKHRLYPLLFNDTKHIIPWKFDVCCLSSLTKHLTPRADPVSSNPPGWAFGLSPCLVPYSIRYIHIDALTLFCVNIYIPRALSIVLSKSVFKFPFIYITIHAQYCYSF